MTKMHLSGICLLQNENLKVKNAVFESLACLKIINIIF